jgi:hypothetical protein
LFDNPSLDFSPDLQNGYTSKLYLGPGDELQVSVYGCSTMSIPVSVEGKISIDYVGHCCGRRRLNCYAEDKSAIAGVYSTVASGQLQVSVSLNQICTIKKLTVPSKPGNYSVPLLVYNALYVAGGPAQKTGATVTSS